MFFCVSIACVVVRISFRSCDRKILVLMKPMHIKGVVKLYNDPMRVTGVIKLYMRDFGLNLQRLCKGMHKRASEFSREPQELCKLNS